MSTTAAPATTSPAPAAGRAAAAPAPRTAAVAAVVVLGSLMTVLDTTIVNVALNRLAEDFAAPLATIQWVTTGYTLALATVTPVTAWAIGRFGTRRLYLTALALFVLGSGLAGTAWDAPSLIAFRVLQGLGGGMVMPVGMTVLVRASDPARTGRTMSVLGIPVLIGPLAGPVLGGWLVDEATWRWVFLVNLPIGLLALALALRLLPRDTGDGTRRRLDLPGLLMLSPGLAALIYGLAAGAERGGLGAPDALLPTLAGAALVAAFAVRALTARDPLIDLRLLRRRAFAGPAATLALFACGYFGSMLLLPLYYQLVRGQSATDVGLLGIPQALATGITMQIAGRLTDRIAAGRIVLTGAAVATTGFLAFTVQVAAGTPYWQLIAALVLMGTGVGMTIMPTIAAATRGVAPADVPAATTLVTIVQQVAGSTGTALMSVLLTGALAGHLPDGGGLAALHGLDAAARAALAPGLAAAFRDTYGWAVALLALALLPALLLPRRGPKSRQVRTS
ncbi:DHA2 family efflux MFS transporter permease subunit [Kitasatospora sp. CM 4170]|uniref:DHA2 family efflux MFS transporter permease subunit n=1 Tax=Kitasatospora aburaviensis TaxID=67265 RepID=A0ABW1F5T0_9ACTN|nr:DHA2 family efflux MFS transporter permease subunit [Kitasatospora sp. CM 4170]WNM47399.1 DHA2 family efflux MFS transporter permease subunit [Kitasatospora sp. CM 4170]